MAGVDKEFDGDYQVNDGIKIGYLAQEPPLDEGETVMENIEPALAEVRGMVKEFEEVSLAMGDPDADMDKLMNRMDELQNALDACNGWEVDRQLERAMDALRCPPGDAPSEPQSLFPKKPATDVWGFAPCSAFRFGQNQI